MQNYKFLLAAACLSLAAPLAHAEKKTPSAAQYHQAGLVAIQKGEAVKARQYLAAAVKLAPNNGNYRAALLDLDAKKGAMTKIAGQRKLASITIPKIELNEATISDSFEALSLIIETTEGPESVPNFIVQDPDQMLADRLVTLKLNNVPAKAVLDFILNSTRAKADYGEYGITITPR